MQNGNHEELLMALYKMVNELSNKVEALNKSLNKDRVEKEWLTLAEAATVAGVSNNTFVKFRAAGLRVCEIEGTKRVNKYELNTFLKKFAS